jgi:hypothetical protein
VVVNELLINIVQVAASVINERLLILVGDRVSMDLISLCQKLAIVLHVQLN